MAVKYVFEVKTTTEGGNVYDTFNVAARDFAQAVQKAEEEIAADAAEYGVEDETIISVTRGVKIGKD